MAERIVVEGADQLVALARDCKAAGERLPREFYAAINHATKPAAAAVFESFMHTLPKGTGIQRFDPATGHKTNTGDWLGAKGRVPVNKFIVDSTKVKRQLRTTGRTAGVRIIAVGQHDIRSLNRGILRAPTFGHKGKGMWHNQHITPGMFDRPLEELAPEVQIELITVMGRIQRELAGRL